MLSASQSGDWCETLVKARLMERELSVLSPEHEWLPFDMVAYTKSGRFVRIQVKKAGYNAPVDYYQAALGSQRGRGKFVRATSESVDVFVFVVVEHQAYYVVPLKELPVGLGKTVSFFPHRERRNNSCGIDMACYLNNWGVIENW